MLSKWQKELNITRNLGNLVSGAVPRESSLNRIIYNNLGLGKYLQGIGMEQGESKSL